MAKKKQQTKPALPASIIQTFDAAVPVASLEEHPDNPRDGDVGVIAESFQSNGIYDAIVVQQRTRRVLAGNHRLKAARALGIETLPVLYVDVDDAEARRILLVDNRSADRGSYFDDKLVALLSAHMEEAGTLLGTGYDAEDAERLRVALLAGTPDAGDGDEPSGTRVVQASFLVAVECADEGVQQSVYERLSAEGYTCRLIN